MNRTALPLVLSAGLLMSCGSNGTTAAPSHAPAKAKGLPRQVQAVIHTDHGPAGFVVGRDGLFVGNHRGGTVQRIDPKTNRVTSTVTVGGQLNVEDSTSSGGLVSLDEATTSLWACTNTDGVLHQIDPRAMRVTATVPALCDGGARTRVGANLWAVPGPDAKDLLIIDAITAKVLHRVPLGDPGNGWGAAVAFGDHVLIGAGELTPVLSVDGQKRKPLPVGTPWINSSGGRLYRMPMDGALAELDPVTLAVRKTVQVPKHADGDPALVADGAGHLYYRPDYTHVYRVDLDGGAVRLLLTTPWSETPTGMAWAFGSLWITNFDNDTVWRVDPGV